MLRLKVLGPPAECRGDAPAAPALDHQTERFLESIRPPMENHNGVAQSDRGVQDEFVGVLHRKYLRTWSDEFKAKAPEKLYDLAVIHVGDGRERPNGICLGRKPLITEQPLDGLRSYGVLRRYSRSLHIYEVRSAFAHR